MQQQKPLVSVSMITFHAQDFIAEAIEGVLQQKVDFPIEVVIGDDCSRDKTRAICLQYAEKYPDIIRVLPEEKNLGISANTARTMNACTGKYIAVCDGDDIWTDPLKLKKQVAFLEKHPDYGVVYSDVETISETGAVVQDSEQDGIRAMYQQGTIFLKLLQTNFINNSTSLFRREYLEDHIVFPDRDYQIPDYLRWLHISTRAKFYFLNEKTTAYRRHSAGLSLDVPKELIHGNRNAYQRSLIKAILDFDKYNSRLLDPLEKRLIFRKILSTLFRKPGTLKMKLKVMRLLPKYYPGIRNAIRLGIKKIRSVLPHSFQNSLVQSVLLFCTSLLLKTVFIASILTGHQALPM
jgi:glycosyltransferase involved in cell wall biosynthesis